MEASGLWLAIMQRADSVLVPAVEDLSVEELRAQPAGPGSNPIGWLVWHLAHIQDRLIASIAGAPTVWEKDGWNKRFKQGEEALHIPPDQVQTFDPGDAQTLLGYYRAVRQRGAEIIGGLSSVDLDTERQQPGRAPTNVAEMLAMAVGDNLQHIGQIAYLRGLLREQGWYERRRR